MEKSRFSEEMMVKILREADKSPVARVAEKYNVSGQAIYAWRKRFGKLEAVDVKRLRGLEQGNAKLKKLEAERDLEIDVIKTVAAKKDRERARPTQADRVCGGVLSRPDGCMRSAAHSPLPLGKPKVLRSMLRSGVWVDGMWARAAVRRVRRTRRRGSRLESQFVRGQGRWTTRGSRSR